MAGQIITPKRRFMVDNEPSRTRLTLILGGARSGKSHYAEQLASQQGQNVLYIATAEAQDEDMAARIAHHQASRPAHWRTLEAPRQVGAALRTVNEPPDILLLDCLTLLVSNMLLTFADNTPTEVIDKAIQAEIDDLLIVQRQFQAELMIVSNEVGLGIVPAYPLGRVYRDVLGRANQHLAVQADRVIFMVAGLPMVVK